MCFSYFCWTLALSCILCPALNMKKIRRSCVTCRETYKYYDLPFCPPGKQGEGVFMRSLICYALVGFGKWCGITFQKVEVTFIAVAYKVPKELSQLYPLRLIECTTDLLLTYKSQHKLSAASSPSWWQICCILRIAECLRIVEHGVLSCFKLCLCCVCLVVISRGATNSVSKLQTVNSDNGKSVDT